ncbi:3-deoxy-manno-octulosonate cytidylyltransferase [Mucisphaera calidilacus]|uniref:3-deoxy-manno-octulosonate cytidylyltransferase n=1 Tax=Mucisphaera calidilacus TaxID=2527982 RepID=A0A518BY83_9BACT|nr:3-deoxy-manno-octulosonate cytidylyltransferase [Mucisphaera calidilacus]QDU71940.1 3-deoxy-manno-octulosonate cytidylyltransferase [Mucisphaera calidilacus]
MKPRIVIIPARIGSTRFPRKALADRTGQPLVAHVAHQARAARTIDRVIVATDDNDIMTAARNASVDAVMTSPDHPNGTSRLAEALEQIEEAQDAPLDPDAVILNVQGDEPEIDPDTIDRLADALADEDPASTPMASACSPFPDNTDPNDPATVKVVLDRNHRALYFSRALIPHDRTGSQPTILLHHGIYAYRRHFLPTYAGLAPTTAETAESLEQLRVLEHGYAIRMITVQHPSFGIDTPEQYDAFVKRHAQG